MRNVEELECLEIDCLSLFQIQQNTNERGQKCNVNKSQGPSNKAQEAAEQSRVTHVHESFSIPKPFILFIPPPQFSLSNLVYLKSRLSLIPFPIPSLLRSEKPG